MPRRPRSAAAQGGPLAGLLLTAGLLLGSAATPAADPPAAKPAPANAPAEKAGEKPAEKPYDCRFAEEAIKIDGVLDELAWKNAAVVDRFSMPWLGADNRPAAKATRARLLWDRGGLYVGAELDDADIYATITDHDGNTWENDVFEVFLKPSVDKPSYYEFHVTPANTQFDLFLPRRGHVMRFRRDREFHVESAVKLRGTLNRWNDKDEGWTVEMAIPWQDLMPTGGRPEPGDIWRFAICRYDFDIANEKPELSTSVGTATKTHPDFHAHETYEPIQFNLPPADNAARPYGLRRYVPATSSQVVGSPDPPLPYTIQRALPKAQISCPIYVAPQPGTDLLLYITEPTSYKPSKVMRMRNDPNVFEPETLIDVDHPDPKRGTVHYSITFHPKFAENGYVYIGCNGPPRPGAAHPKPGTPGIAPKMTRIVRYVIDRQPPYTFHADSGEVIIEWDSDGHNGGDMAFGPDGMLYVTSGDGTSDSDTDRAGQDLSRLRSKLLRIDVDHPDENTPGDGRAYSVPADNPFLEPDGDFLEDVTNVRPETYAYGLRNPWRIAIDQRNGQIWIGNNGQDLWEQVYLVERGANYGWSLVEGGYAFAPEQKPGPHPVSKPVADHPHAEARSLTGGVVYEGSKLPELKGAYIYGDYSTGRIWSIRHDGRRVTEHRLIADTPLQITSFGLDADGEILITDHQPYDEGGFYRLVPLSPSDPSRQRQFPRRLSETGLFTSVGDHRMAAGVIPYDVNTPFWSDGAEVVRFFALPPTTDDDGAHVPTRIDVTDSGGWKFPDGTVALQSFAVETEEGRPESRRWIETRLMLKEQGEWAAYTYEWNDEQTDASLVAGEGKDRVLRVQTAARDGRPAGVREQPWRFQSRAECMACHSRAANYVLGLCTVQLNRDFDYKAALGDGHAADNQLRSLERIGVLRNGWWGGAAWGVNDEAKKEGLFGDAVADRVAEKLCMTREDLDTFAKRQSSLLSRSPAAINRLVDPRNASRPLEARARSYLHANCSSCHMQAGGGNSMVHFNYITGSFVNTIADMHAIDEKPIHHTFDLENPMIIASGHPERSVVISRISRRGGGQMPQLGTAIVDEQAVQLLREWISSLPEPKPADTSLSKAQP